MGCEGGEADAAARCPRAARRRCGGRTTPSGALSRQRSGVGMVTLMTGAMTTRKFLAPISVTRPFSPFLSPSTAPRLTLPPTTTGATRRRARAVVRMADSHWMRDRTRWVGFVTLMCCTYPSLVVPAPRTRNVDEGTATSTRAAPPTIRPRLSTPPAPSPLPELLH